MFGDFYNLCFMTATFHLQILSQHLATEQSNRNKIFNKKVNILNVAHVGFLLSLALFMFHICSIMLGEFWQRLEYVHSEHHQVIPVLFRAFSTGALHIFSRRMSSIITYDYCAFTITEPRQTQTNSVLLYQLRCFKKLLAVSSCLVLKSAQKINTKIGMNKTQFEDRCCCFTKLSPKHLEHVLF